MLRTWRGLSSTKKNTLVRLKGRTQGLLVPSKNINCTFESSEVYRFQERSMERPTSLSEGSCNFPVLSSHHPFPLFDKPPSLTSSGKVRDVYTTADSLLLISTDRQSAFDRNLASIPFKGQVLNLTSQWYGLRQAKREAIDTLLFTFLRPPLSRVLSPFSNPNSLFTAVRSSQRLLPSLFPSLPQVVREE